MINDVANLLEAVIWPLIILIAIYVFKEPLVALLDRIREVEGPGDLRLSMDKKEVEKIIREGKEKEDDPEIIAQRILNSLDKRETRILRALLDDGGRKIYSYQSSYYKDAVQELIGKGYVEKQGKGYALTDKGFEFTKEYLLSVFQISANV